ncbi:MAG: hypothetical protein JNK82_35250 [Myxococcaceae bacterium]|nr:hypothetical protein [Myxococcaceae bacterium]
MPGLLLALVVMAAPKVVMPQWTRVEVSPELGTFYADRLARELRTQGLEVITAEELGTLLGIERQKQLLGCNDEAKSCLAELGNALGAEATLVASVARLDQTFSTNLKLLSSQTGRVLAEEHLESKSERALLEDLSSAAEVLARPLLPAPPPGTGRVRKLALVPLVAGVAFAVGGGVSAGFAQSRFDAIRSPMTTRYADAVTLASSGETFQALTWVGVSLAVTCLVVAGVMFFLGGG